MHKLVLLLKYEMHKIIWDFEIATNLQILARKPNLELIHKKNPTRNFVGFGVPVDQRMEIKESEKIDK